MADNDNQIKYVPGMYSKRAKKRINTDQLASQWIHEWETKRLAAIKKNDVKSRVNNCISFSRKIGVGALEIADLVSEKTGLRVVDREILEHIANDSNLSRSTVDFFDERHPGVINNFGAMLFGEKSFTMGDFMRNLITSVYSIADDSPTIFVGRAAHLILPRERVLAVRFISSKDHRVERVADILGISKKAAEKKLAAEDKGQSDFFKKNLKKKDASPYEFDLVINRDYITEASWAADIVEQAYKLKFANR
jgi:cytidylate kinase